MERNDMVFDFFRESILPEQLETGRLLLRRMTVEDAADMYEYARLAQVTRYLLWQEHPSVAYTERYLRYVQGEYRKGRYFDFAIVYKENGKMIGTVGFTELDRAQLCCEIGYVINPAYSGRGIATEAVWALLNFAFVELDMERVEGRYMVENAASRRVMEKCGMRFEGVFRSLMEVKGVRRDIGVCSILKEEYFTKKHIGDSLRQ